MENYRDLLIALYNEHAPENLGTVDYYLEKYKGKEKQYYITQKAKYANKKTVTDSKKILVDAMARIAEKKAAQAKALAASMADVKVPDEPKSQEQIVVNPTPPPVVEPIVPAIEEVAAMIEPEPVAQPEGTIRKEPEMVMIPEEPVIPHREELLPIEEPVHPFQTRIDEPKHIIKEEIPKWESPKPKEPELSSVPPFIPPAKPMTPQPKGKIEKKSPNIFWYFGGAALVILLVAAVIYYFHFAGVNEKKQEQAHVETTIIEQPVTITETVVVTPQVSDSGNQAVMTTPTESTSATTETMADPVTPVVEKKIEEPVVEKQVVEPKQTTPVTTTQPTADRLYNSDITRPAYFVGCFSVETEQLAQKKVEELKKLGLAGHYYWQPELDPAGKAFFKVVVGPFATQREAYPSLTKTQEHINFDAYILPLKIE